MFNYCVRHNYFARITVGRSKDLARVVYLVSLPQFDHAQFRNILHQHQLTEKWIQWAQSLDLKP